MNIHVPFFWCTPGVQGFDPAPCLSTVWRCFNFCWCIIFFPSWSEWHTRPVAHHHPQRSTTAVAHFTQSQPWPDCSRPVDLAKWPSGSQPWCGQLKKINIHPTLGPWDGLYHPYKCWGWFSVRLYHINYPIVGKLLVNLARSPFDREYRYPSLPGSLQTAGPKNGAWTNRKWIEHVAWSANMRIILLSLSPSIAFRPGLPQPYVKIFNPE